MRSSQRLGKVSQFSKKAGILIVALAISSVSAEILFQDNFDNQSIYNGDDYLSGTGKTLSSSNGDTLPKGWDAISLWSSYEESHLQIVSQPSDMVFGETGKSLVMRRASKSNGWHGDSQLVKLLDEGIDEIYVSFWIKFQPGWTVKSGNASKIFRIGWAEPGATGSDFWGKIGMGIIWDWIEWEGSGVRNNIMIRPNTSSFSNPNLGIQPPYYNGSGSFNSNFTSFPYDLSGDGKIDNEPNIVDKLTGEIIPPSGMIARHENIFGSDWNRMEFYLKLNSKPGMQDGIIRQWFNGSLILSNETMPWLQLDGDPTAKFNNVRFGGNDFFNAFEDSEKVQEWYAIDNIEIRTKHPNEPKPPSNFVIGAN